MKGLGILLLITYYEIMLLMFLMTKRNSFDIVKWEDKGEYYDYSDTDSSNVRFFPSFVLPDGSQVCDADDVCYKSKVYRGEYFLKPLPALVDLDSVSNLVENYVQAW